MGRSANYSGTSSRRGCVPGRHRRAVDSIDQRPRRALAGKTRFEQWQDGLGLARNVLAARLKSLTADGVFEARQYCVRPPRFEYLLTGKGEALRPLVLHMMHWGTQHVYGEVKPGGEYVHTACGHTLTPQTRCLHCQAAVVPAMSVIR